MIKVPSILDQLYIELEDETDPFDDLDEILGEFSNNGNKVNETDFGANFTEV